MDRRKETFKIPMTTAYREFLKLRLYGAGWRGIAGAALQQPDQKSRADDASGNFRFRGIEERTFCIRRCGSAFGAVVAFSFFSFGEAPMAAAIFNN
jgi:hypothetical protein